ncbi:WD-40 repeat protein, partial [Reticulomyxa filosa]
MNTYPTIYSAFEQLIAQRKAFLLIKNSQNKIIVTDYCDTKNITFIFHFKCLFSFYKQKLKHFFYLASSKNISTEDQKSYKNELKLINQSESSLSLKEEVQIIIRHWIRIFHIELGWIENFDKLVFNYAFTFFMFDTFLSSSKLINTFTGHTNAVLSIDYSTFNDCQLICSGSDDMTVRVWDVDNNKQIPSFNKHSSYVCCVKFSSYHYHYHRQNVICSSSTDKTIRFWDFKHNKQIQIFNGRTNS